MTIRFLPPDLPDKLARRGVNVIPVEGWRTRTRPASTGDFDPEAQLWHHTGAKDTNPLSIKDDIAYAEWLAKIGRSDLPAPLCQDSIGRTGAYFLCAAGRGNHAGVAKPVGGVPGGDGNALYVGHECQNDGTEGWKPDQYNAMVLVGATFSLDILKTPARANNAHKETSVTGKWDPGALDMDRFRDDIADKMADFIQDDKPPTKQSAVEEARALLEAAIQVAIRRGKKDRVRKLRAALKLLPAR